VGLRAKEKPLKGIGRLRIAGLRQGHLGLHVRLGIVWRRNGLHLKVWGGNNV
jgi:hypothetical protein